MRNFETRYVHKDGAGGDADMDGNMVGAGAGGISSSAAT